MTETLRRTPLDSWHVAQGGRMVDFAGWSMPVQYTTIVAEHAATRTAAALFDISHMGRLRFDGPDAAGFLDRLVTRRVANLRPGQIRYALVTNQQGGILDDVLVYRLEQPDGGTLHMLVVNASNREKILAWIAAHRQLAGDCQVVDQTFETAMIALQGPRAVLIADSLLTGAVSPLAYYSGLVTQLDGRSIIVSRTGYTGEDGCELIVPAEAAVDIWQQVVELGVEHGLQPAGLGARDTLRLEAAMPLYGHELSEQIDPYQAGLGFAVQLKDREFIGCDALRARKDDPRQSRRVGLQLQGRRVPREHYAVLAGEQVVGEVTSGTFSPTLQKPIAMAYVQPEHAQVGAQLAVDIRGRQEPAEIVDLPFYKRPSGQGN